nr:MerR family transcriptional regulator [Aurantimonas sp. CSK15Z-1]
MTASRAARRLGVSIKALRLYERHGLLAPSRTASGWRAYGPRDMRRAADVLRLRRLGFGLAEIAHVLDGGAELDAMLAAHQTRLEKRLGQLGDGLSEIIAARRNLAACQAATAAPSSRPSGTADGVKFALPWPWDGESFELPAIGPITYITGPLGSGKTRLAKRIAECLPGARWIGLDRGSTNGGREREPRSEDTSLAKRLDRALGSIRTAGGTVSSDLETLICLMDADDPSALVVDMVEQGLDRATQEALMGHLRARGTSARPLILLTRSSSILDIAALGPADRILFCPANHSPPLRVLPHAGSHGYDSLVSCLAAPEVRARTSSVVARRVEAA